MTDARNFLLDTDYPLDKVVFLASGSAVVPAGTWDAISPGITIPHDIGTFVLPVLIWSNTADFAVSHEGFDEAFALSYWGTPDGQQYTVTATPDEVVIFRINNTATDKTLYYRILCFMPSTADIETESSPTSSAGDNFILDTDKNYMKLVHSGVLTAADETYNHNLGYVPRARMWFESSNAAYPISGAQDVSTDPTGSVGATSGPHIDSTKIEYLNNFGNVHYRIYADE